MECKVIAAESLHRRLLVRFPPKAQQCTQDYLMSLADANKLGGINELCKLYGITPSTLTRLTESDVQELIRGEPPVKAIELAQQTSKRKYYNWKPLHSKICPLCIEEKRPIPDAFNLPFSFICAFHQSALHDTCPTCATPYTYFRKSRGRCNRGCVINSINFPKTDNNVIKIQNTFSPWRLLDNPTIKSLEPLYFDTFICKLIRLLCKKDKVTWRYNKISTADIVKFSNELIANQACFLNLIERLYEAISYLCKFDSDFVHPIRKLYNNGFYQSRFELGSTIVFL